MSAEQFSRLILSTSFAVWVIYGVLQGIGHWPMAVAFGLLGIIGLLGLEFARHLKIKLLDWVMLAYFVIAAAATFLLHSAAFPAYSSVVVWMLYAAVTWVSILMDSPFSLQYARESSPPEKWGSPVFLQINRVISTVWGIAFSANLVMVAVATQPRYKSLLLGVAGPLLAVAAATIFTSRYTKYRTRRAQHAEA
jgi:hypothetical protein